MSKQPELKTIVRPLAWVFVITCWIFYGLIVWVSIAHPRPEKDPVTDFQDGLKDMHEHWGFSIFMLVAIIAYVISRAYIKETKKEKGKLKNADTTRTRTD